MLDLDESVPFSRQALLEDFSSKNLQVWIKEMDFQGHPPNTAKEFGKHFTPFLKSCDLTNFTNPLKGLPEFWWSCPWGFTLSTGILIRLSSVYFSFIRLVLGTCSSHIQTILSSSWQISPHIVSWIQALWKEGEVENFLALLMAYFGCYRFLVHSRYLLVLPWDFS